MAARISPTIRPLPKPIPTLIPTQTRDHPAAFRFNIALPTLSVFETQKVVKLTVQLQQVRMTMGEMTKVAKKLTTQMFSRPRLSLTATSFIFGYTFWQNIAERNPANMPQAIAAPMLVQVPATGPYMIAPMIVPRIDSRMPILRVSESKMEKMQVAMTLALRAKKVPKKASCQTQLLEYSPDAGLENLRERNVVVEQKARKRKKVPI